MRIQKIPLPWPHSDGQREIITYPGNVVLLGGRRWGKTIAGVERILLAAQKQTGIYWWVGLSWRSASMKRAWRLLRYYGRQAWEAIGASWEGKIRTVDKEVHLPNGSEIWLRTADNPESLTGEGLRAVILDEFTLMKPSVWGEYVQSSLLDFGGWAMFMGVPKGNNWASNLWRKAKDLDGWIQRHYTTYDNPTIPRKRIDKQRDEMTAMMFDQEIMADILANSGAVFRRVREAATAAYQLKAIEGHEYVMGADWGKYNDFTVLTIIDVNDMEACRKERFNQIDYSLQRGRLKTLYDTFKPYVVMAERNSMGDPIIEQLVADDIPVWPFNTTNASKKLAIEALALALERGQLSILDDTQLIAELQSFEATRLPSGMLRYGAPSGMHDDCVISLALAWHAVVGGGLD